jgi:hypothetical protein
MSGSKVYWTKVDVSSLYWTKVEVRLSSAQYKGAPPFRNGARREERSFASLGMTGGSSFHDHQVTSCG